jgi:hypothetical protein
MVGSFSMTVYQSGGRGSPDQGRMGEMQKYWGKHFSRRTLLRAGGALAAAGLTNFSSRYTP